MEYDWIMTFPSYWECHRAPTDELIFFRGVVKNYQPAWFIQDGAPKKAKLPYKWLNYDLLPIKLNQFITGHHPVGPFFTAGKWVISDDCDGFCMCFGLDKHGDFLWKMMIFGRCFTGRWMEREGFPVWVARFPRIIAKLHLRNTRPGLQVNKKRWKDPPCYVAGKINYISMAIL